VDLVAVLSGFAFAMNNIAFRASQTVPVSLKVVAMFFGCAGVAGLLVGFGVQDIPQGVSPTSWGLVVAFGFGILLTTSGTQYGVNHLEAGRSSIIMILELLSAAVSSAVIGARMLSTLELVGGALIIGASLLEGRAGAEAPAVVVAQPS
jgi:drug/metabolite transporter (DMT)-like permease